MFEGLGKKLSGYKNYCRSKKEPLSICTYYDKKEKDKADCEFYKNELSGDKCDHYFNDGHCRNQKAQDDGRK